MSTMTFLVVAGVAATIFALFQGIASMAHGGPADQARSPMLMFRRVGWQALTVLLVLLILLSQTT
jgi:hypothetical protein